MEIEVFRAGSAAAIAAGITATDLADIAAFDCANHPVPNVIGHPTTDAPARGAIRRFRVEGDKLFADVPETLAAFRPIVDGIKGGSILNRSMGFFGKRHPSNPTPGKLAPKHLGFLGAMAPGIAGMPPLASYFAANPASALTFAADGVTLEVGGDPLDAVVFDAPAEAPTGVITVTEPTAEIVPPPPAAAQESTMTPDEITAAAAKLKADQDAHAAEVAQFAADRKATREAGNAATVKGLVTAGVVIPADEADLVAAFNAVDGGDVIAFSADATKKASPVAIIAGVLAKAGKATPVGESRTSPEGEAPTFEAKGATDLDAVRKARMDKYGK